jgi:hypothetical protein
MGSIDAGFVKWHFTTTNDSIVRQLTCAARLVKEDEFLFEGLFALWVEGREQFKIHPVKQKLHQNIVARPGSLPGHAASSA